MQDIITTARLSRYQKEGESQEDAIKRYIWNIQLSESFYPALALFEIALRNRIDDVICQKIDPLWLDENWKKWPQKAVYERTKIQEAKQKLKKRQEKYTRGHLIAELTLGFWIGLLKKPFKPIIWQRSDVFESVFPNFTDTALDRITLINPHLETIRVLRNRISHHEPIHDWSGGLDTAYKAIETAIFWISEDTHRNLQEISRFPLIWAERD